MYVYNTCDDNCDVNSCVLKLRSLTYFDRQTSGLSYRWRCLAEPHDLCALAFYFIGNHTQQTSQSNIPSSKKKNIRYFTPFFTVRPIQTFPQPRFPQPDVIKKKYPPRMTGAPKTSRGLRLSHQILCREGFSTGWEHLSRRVFRTARDNSWCVETRMCLNTAAVAE